MRDNKIPVLKIYTILFFLYIFTPLLLIFIFAWNKGEGYVFPLQGFTWKWFIELFSDDLAKKSIGNSVIIALSSATISTILATLLAIGLIKGGFRRPQLFLSFLILPVLMPSLTIGISALRDIGLLGVVDHLVDFVAVAIVESEYLMVRREFEIDVS